MRAKICQSYPISPLIAALGLVLLLMPQTIAQSADSSNPNQTPFEKALQPYYPDIVKALLINGVVDPDLNGANAEQMTAAMVTNGMQVLDDDTALEVLKLRAEMAKQATTEVCAQMWTGQYGTSLMNQIDALPGNQQLVWAEIFDRAAQAIVRADEPIPPQPEDTKAAMRQILSGASSTDSSALVNAARNPQAMGSDQLCVATRALYAGAMRLPRKNALAITRAILFQPG